MQLKILRIFNLQACAGTQALYTRKLTDFSGKYALSNKLDHECADRLLLYGLEQNTLVLIKNETSTEESTS